MPWHPMAWRRAMSCRAMGKAKAREQMRNSYIYSVIVKRLVKGRLVRKIAIPIGTKNKNVVKAASTETNASSASIEKNQPPHSRNTRKHETGIVISVKVRCWMQTGPMPNTNLTPRVPRARNAAGPPST